MMGVLFDYFDVEEIGDELHANINYPISKRKFIVIDQVSVRASSPIRVYFDYDRDGFAIERMNNACNWCEVAFVDSFGPEDIEGAPE